MPTIVTHALLPLIAAAAVPDFNLSRRLIFAGMAMAMFPDADLIARQFGVPHTHDFGHRGATHTLAFALAVGALGVLAAKALAASRRACFGFLFVSCLSHPLADMLTDGGKGMMLFWPVLRERFVWPMRPVEVSPVGLRAIASGAIDDILLSELMWLILPALLLAALCRWWRRPYIDLARGQS